jgi:TRAP-type C4-dicarboxylate transport system permease small subunit
MHSELGLLAALGAALFAEPFSTSRVLTALAIGSAALPLVKRFLLTRHASGRALLAGLRHLEIGLLALIVLGMVILSAVQIAARNLAGSGILWIDPLLRYLTLWIGFVGGAVATREGRHIQMDVLGRLLPPRIARLGGRVAQLAAAITCMILAESAYRHLAAEYAYESREFLGIPTWILLSVIPLSLGLISYRFADRALFPPAAEGAALEGGPVSLDAGAKAEAPPSAAP